jgi:NAD(P)-dependent dehydrogenase (short-subunit alcohol dehydrogenase family)
MSISLKGRTALVTGVSSGLGAGIMRTFAGYGATVVGVARREQGQRLSDEVRKGGGQAVFVQGDITQQATIERAVAACLDNSGRIDILINNAGMSGPIALADETDFTDWRAVIETNLTAVFGLSRAVIPHMRRQQDGTILNIASINAKFGVTKMAAYCAAKAGVVHLTKVIAAETIGANVRANAIILGGVVSEMATATTIAMAKAETGLAGAPSKERLSGYERMMMPPDEVAKSLAVLCLPEAGLITGSEIAIDRGFTAGVAASTIIHQGAAALMG